MTAETIVAARPIPQDLGQIVAPRVPGLSRPKVATLVDSGQVCVTPAPFYFRGTTWRWVGADSGAVVSAAGDSHYALIVPPHRVQTSTGAWATITPAVDSSLPKADAHIWGSWTPEVGLRLPDAVDTSSAPAVVHDTANGPAVSWGTDGIAREAAGTVVAALSSLSDTAEFDKGLMCVFHKPAVDNGSLFCGSDTARDDPLAQVFGARADYAGRYVAHENTSGPCGVPIATSVGRAISSGELSYGISCFADVDAAEKQATFTFSNDSGASILFGLATSFGSVIAMHPSNGSFQYGEPTVEGDHYGLAASAVAKALVRKTHVLLPRTSIPIIKDLGSGPTTFEQSVWGSNWKNFWILFNALDVIDAAADLGGVDIPAVVSCVAELGTDPSYPSLVSCIVAVQTDRFHAAEEAARKAGNTAKAAKYASLVKGLSLVGYGLIVDDFAASFLTQAAAVIQGSKHVTIDFIPPVSTGNGGTGAPGSGSLAADGSYIARTASGNGYLVNPITNTANEIRNGGDFLCYAQNRVVRDLLLTYSDGGGTTYLHLSPAVRVTGTFAPPCQPPAVHWIFAPPPAGNTPDNIILRGPEGITPTPTWLINNRGEIQVIPNGGVYECLVHANPVLWNAPLEAALAWPTVGSEAASCG